MSATTEAVLKPRNRVRALRKQAGLSVDELAKRASLARSTVYYADSPLSCPSLPTVAALCRALGVPVEQLICD